MIIRFRKLKVLGITGAVALLLLGGLSLANNQAVLDTLSPQGSTRLVSEDIKENNEQLLLQGQNIFRYDTFGDEKFWGNTLQLHKAIAGASLGGIGEGISPNAALGLGLKIDKNKLSGTETKMLKEGKLNLNDPAVTVSLLKSNAVIGVTGFFDEKGSLCSVGIQCSICHSTVDNSFAPGIGNRLDGWANRDLNVGAIIAAAPNQQVLADRLGLDVAKVRKVLLSWGPGKYDAELLEDGKGFRPDGKPAATLIPPAFGLAGVNLHTWTGWGSVPYWNAYVATTQMRAQGTFYDPRLNNPEQFPIAVKTGDWNIRNTPDMLTSKLPALHLYQLALTAPKPPEGSFDKAAAKRGEALFLGKAACARCHVPPLYLEPGYCLHTPEEVGIDSFQADRSPVHGYRTSPLRGLWTHQKGGFFHDGRFATLLDVVNHFNKLNDLKLTEQEKTDVVEFLKSL